MQRNRLFRVALTGFVAAILAGCSGEALFYRTDGAYTASVSTETAAPSQQTSGVSQGDGPISAKGVLRMCSLSHVAWQLNSGPADLGKPAAIQTTISPSLCQTGTKTITSGKVLVWGQAPSSPGTTGVVSDEWTVTGTITVTEYSNLNPPEPSLNQEVLSERAVGTVSITATTSDGRTVKLESGTFTFLIYTRKSEYSPVS